MTVVANGRENSRALVPYRSFSVVAAGVKNNLPIVVVAATALAAVPASLPIAARVGLLAPAALTAPVAIEGAARVAAPRPQLPTTAIGRAVTEGAGGKPPVGPPAEAGHPVAALPPAATPGAMAPVAAAAGAALESSHDATAKTGAKKHHKHAPPRIVVVRERAYQAAPSFMPVPIPIPIPIGGFRHFWR